MRVLSFDCGLRNLGVALVELRAGYALPPECRTYAHADETADELKTRALKHFLTHGWRVVHAALEDVSKELGRDKPVKKILQLGPVAKAQALAHTLERLESAWFGDGSVSDFVAVEVQHNANAEMRAVSMAIHVFFMRSMVDSKFMAVKGDKKLVLCSAVGVERGMGVVKRPRKSRKAGVVAAPSEEDVDDAPAKKPAGAVVYRGNSRAAMWAARTASAPSTTSAGLTKKEQYADNKKRAPMALRQLMHTWRGDGPAGLLDLRLVELMQDPNVADAVLQGVWVLWSEHVQPRAPPKGRKRKIDAKD
jgi:hypothetical protein